VWLTERSRELIPETTKSILEETTPVSVIRRKEMIHPVHSRLALLTYCSATLHTCRLSLLKTPVVQVDHTVRSQCVYDL